MRICEFRQPTLCIVVCFPALGSRFRKPYDWWCPCLVLTQVTRVHNHLYELAKQSILCSCNNI